MRRGATPLRFALLAALVAAGFGVRLHAPSASASGRTAGAAVCTTYSVTVRVDPFIPTDLGDRVVMPTTVYVEAPGAVWVEVYVQPIDAPYGGMRLGAPALLGSASAAAGAEFAVPWSADEPYPYVEVYAIAYGQPDVNYSRVSAPVTIVLDWRQRPGRS